MLEGAEGPAVVADPTTRPPPRFSFAVSRDRSSVAVTVHGELDQLSAERLAPVLRDLIGDRANRVVVVDLGDVCGVDPEALELFSTASGLADHHGTRFRVQGPPGGLEVRIPARRTRSTVTGA